MRKKTGIAVRAEEDEEEEEVVEVVACGCVGPCRTEVEAKTREKEWEQGEKNRKDAAGRVRKRKKEEILQGAINSRR